MPRRILADANQIERLMTPPCAPSCRKNGEPPCFSCFFVTAIIAFVLLFTDVSLSDTPADPSAFDHPRERIEDDYVGSRACQTCHEENYHSWHGSYHRTMTQAAKPASVLGKFNATSLEYDDKLYRLERRDDEFWLEMDDPSWKDKSRRPPRVKRQLVMTTGSHHMQVYWYATGYSRVLGQLPFVWLIDEQRWIPRNAAFLRPSGSDHSEAGRWNLVCVRCHATHGRFGGKDWLHAQTRAVEFGISCEACHGPGGHHVRLHEQTKRGEDSEVVGNVERDVVNPANLSHQRSSQICGNCHSVNLFHTVQAADNWAIQGQQYRPGSYLSQHRFIVDKEKNSSHPMLKLILKQDPHFLADQFWNDGMVQIAGREYNGLINSPCYQRGEMSCLSCHVMHQRANDPRPLKEWADDQLAERMRSNEACLQCHDSLRDKSTLRNHTHHASGSTGANCLNCHMPFTSYGLLKAVRSHQISSPDVATSIATGRPNACNQCHLDKTLAWTSRYLEEWYDRKPLELNLDEQSIAASVLWLLRGDAGQRALMAWNLGWEPALKVSGTQWTHIYLTQLLLDRYEAVRAIAYRSLRRHPNFQQFEFDFLASKDKRVAAAQQAINIWQKSLQERGPQETGAAILVDERGHLLSDVYGRLLKGRDNRRIVRRE